MPDQIAYEWNRLMALGATGILLGLLVLLGLHLGGRLPELPTIPAVTRPIEASEPLKEIEPLFSLNTSSNMLGTGKATNPFYTAYFVPKKPAPPAPPTTREVKLFFHGFYESANGKRFVYIRVDDALRTFEVGDTVVGTYSLREIELDHAVLMDSNNDLAQLPFDKPTSLKVPIQ